MKALFSSPRAVLAVLVIFGLLCGALTSADAQQSSPRRHKKHAPATEQADAVDAPAASPTPTAKPDKPAPTPSPAPASETKPTSADEAAPSKATASGTPAASAVSTIDPAEIEGFDANPEPVKKLLLAALDLTKRNLTYTYGSADPSAGGMDCSGTIYYLLKQAGFTDVPRQANEQYDWVRQKSHFYAVLSKKQDNFELREMRPGDLLFWTGTYRVDRDPPVTHTMIYLGKRKKDGRRLMFGSSDGRPYDGQRRNGVSVFDFKMPAAKHGDAADATTAAAPDNAPDFSGYGPVPGMADVTDVTSRQTVSAKPTPGAKSSSSAAEAVPDDSPAATPKPKAKKKMSSPRPRSSQS